MREILKIVFVIIGTLIGAGFASGQEIYSFFFKYGKSGILGIVLMSILLLIILVKILTIICENKIDTYKEFLELLINRKRQSNNKYLNIKNITSNIINIFILITFYIMVAGFGAYFNQEFAINSLIGSVILAIIIYLTLLNDIKGLIRANEILIPTLILLVLIIGVISIKGINIKENIENMVILEKGSIVMSSIIYTSYNTILMIPVIITLRKYIKSNKEIKIISILVAIIILILSTLIYFMLFELDINDKVEMPIVYIVSKTSIYFKYVYGCIILGSIYTTAISLGNSFLKNTTKTSKRFKSILIVICISSVMFSKIGFSNLVNLLYPIFGYIGLFQICNILFIRQK